jgi:hypothetical protein
LAGEYVRFDHGDAKTIEEIKRLDALLEYAVMHEDEAEAARLRAELAKLVEKV